MLQLSEAWKPPATATAPAAAAAAEGVAIERVGPVGVVTAAAATSATSQLVHQLPVGHSRFVHFSPTAPSSAATSVPSSVLRVHSVLRCRGAS